MNEFLLLLQAGFVVLYGPWIVLYLGVALGGTILRYVMGYFFNRAMKVRIVSSKDEVI